ncbi:efflux RND transporter permease subunit [Rhodoferax sp.]|uniref:efflux RND transporter permease subunit n=1 Tax=Rhodoferax sp. TaxID=50421 RepID=UPI0028443077|nr:efflux RND transporter permease subunit [Rhodoferax sp.]MDR3368457.1 efflux RND transporter permease subunit [Rhodoferax sp.]
MSEASTSHASPPDASSASGAAHTDHRNMPLNIVGKLTSTFLESKITVLLMVAIILAGLLALFVTAREYNPQIVVPAANIIVAKPGASAQEIQNLVVKPLEALMNAQSGVKHTFGYSAADYGVVTVQFEVGENQETSLVKLYNQLMQNMDRLPAGAMQPMVKPINVDDVPIMTLTLSSTQLPEHELRQVAARVLEELRNLPGVSFSQLMDGSQRAVNVWISPAKLAASGLSLDQVNQMMKGANVSIPVGQLVDNNLNQPLRFSGFIGSVKDVGDIIVGVPQGRPVFLKDVARIEDGPSEADQLSRFAYGPAAGPNAPRGEATAVTLVIAKKAGTNAVEVASAVLGKLDTLKRVAIPQGVDVAVTRDDGAKADDAVNTLVEHLGIAIGSVALILLVFLGWREAAIVTLTVPLILFVVLTVGLITGQTINRITLFALILSLGLLVDDAIVVIENIHRHMHMGGGRNFKHALVQATNEIGKPTNIATITVILAFIPMAFVTGMMGPFMRPIPLNVPVAMLTSLLMAYMVVPWAANRWLAGKAARALSELPAHQETGEHPKDPLYRAYTAAITPFIRHAGRRNVLFLVVLALLLAAMVQPAWQFIRPSGMNGPLSPMGVELKMLPNDNTNTFLVQVDMPAGTTLAGTDQVARAVGEVLAANRHVHDYQTFLGMAAPIDFAALVRGDSLKRGDNLAQIRVNLSSKHERSEPSHEIVNAFNDSLADLRKTFPQAKVKLYETPPGPPVSSQILAELYGPDYDKLRAAASEVDKAFGDIYGMVNVDDSVTASVQSLRIKVDREKAILAGVAPGQIAKLLHDYVSGFSIGTLHVDDAREPINITVRLPRSERQTAQQILSIRITNMTGQQVPLSAIASVESGTQDKPIYDRDQHPMVMVGGELLKSSPVYAVLALDKMLEHKMLVSGVAFNTGNLGFTEAHPDNVMNYHLLWGGEMRLTLDVFRDLGSAFIVALVFIYLVLVGYYKSFVMPLIVMGAIPLTLIGVFPGHWLTNQAFTATSMIGVIALAGVVVRNSLLLIDFIVDYRNRGYGLEQAVVDAGAARFRPIMLTALAIILGSAIMITDPVFGGLAVSLIFGTFASTALTLLVIPLMYYLWERRLDQRRQQTV